MNRTRSWLGTDYSAHVASDLKPVPAVPVMWTILVVDDDPIMLQSVKELLEVYGYDCLLAEGREAALAIIAAQPVDLILLDLSIPAGDGYQLMQALEKDHSSTDLIIISDQRCFDDAARALRSGARDFLQKPYAAEELIGAIERVSRKRRLERKVQLMHRRLTRSEQQHRFIVNNSPDIIYMLDGSGRFSFVNERAETLLGYSREELDGRHYADLVHQDDLEQARHTFAERRTGSRACHTMEFRLLHKPKDIDTRYLQPRAITVELSAMGVYAEAGAKKREFVGTYGVIRDISERKRAEEMVNFQLYHDLLTELPNRALFRDRLKLSMAQAKRSQSQLAVMYLDMDRFKIINDTLGHLVGDQVLQSVAVKLRGCLRDSDTLARVGGDEFNLLLPNISSERDAALIATKILEELEKPMALEGVDVFISFSIGIAIYPKDGDTIDELIKHADTAMYHVKERGKKNFEFYAAAMTYKHNRHRTLENSLREALQKDQLRVYYQPQIDLASGAVCGLEALLRWQHPEQGIVPADEFVPLSEQIGVITEMGQWLLNQACKTIKNCARQGLPEVTLAVNVSARELIQTDFPDYVFDALQRHQLPARQLELEITENVLMRDMELVASKLRRLSQRGVRIAVDDFGSGYSSLSYLQSLPLSTLKIDRSFISQIGDGNNRDSIVYAIIAMAKGLDLALVAEGVETRDQLEFLKTEGCPRAQGFYTGQPKPAEELIQSLTDPAA